MGKFPIFGAVCLLAALAAGASAVVFLGGSGWRSVRDDDGFLRAIERTDQGIELRMACGNFDEVHQTGDVPLSGVTTDSENSVHVGYWVCGRGAYSCFMRNGSLHDAIMANEPVAFTYHFANSSKTSVTYDLRQVRPLYVELREDCRRRSRIR